jgi:hypothetical protein
MRVVKKANSGSGELLQQLLRDVRSNAVVWWGVNPVNNPENTSPAIACGPIIDGVEQLAKLAEGKVGVPKFTTNLAESRQWEAAAPNTVWGRLNNHTQGKDIRRSVHKEWATREYWVKQIPQEAIIGEWRLHVFNGLSIGRGKKTKLEDIARRLASVVRSRRNGWRLDHTQEPPQGAKFYAKLAVQTLGYLWGAVDMLEVDLTRLTPDLVENLDRLVASKAKSNLSAFVVLEVNQMPGMDNSTAAAYAKAITGYAEKLNS